MPRPGPRPYECVRRAWHSDRHQPMRGSLIQEIFRIANEVHSTVTKKNKEWQEKLPVVVLKAEEIMYSKANSEAEYMDLKTLWDRTNDAINTIIRLDESTETGDLLQPCIEAALNLGCTPRRASRSQSNCTASYYLNLRNQKPDHLFPDAMNNAVKKSSNLHCNPMYPNFGSTTVGNFASTGPKLQEFAGCTNNCQTGEVAHSKLRCTEDNDPLPGDNKSAMLASYPCSGLWSVFPLLYGDSMELKSAFGVQSPLEPVKSLEPVTVGVARNLFGVDSTSVKISKSGWDNGYVSPHEFECDLSLRLGTPSSASPVVDMENRLNERMPCRESSFQISPWVIEDGLSNSCSSECANIDFNTKKRKTHNSNDHALCWEPKLPVISRSAEQKLRLVDQEMRASNCDMSGENESLMLV